MLKLRLRALRQNKKLTQSDMAQKIDVARTTYAMYEQGNREPDNETLQKIANYFNVTTDYLLGRTDNPEPFNNKDEFNPMDEINQLLKKYDIDQSGFFDIEKWKSMGPDEIRELESYFEFITSKAKKKADSEALKKDDNR